MNLFREITCQIFLRVLILVPRAVPGEYEDPARTEAQTFRGAKIGPSATFYVE